MEQDVVELVDRVRAGDKVAAEELWKRFSGEMLAHVHAILRSASNRGAFDSEGILNSGYRSFFSAIQKPDFDSRSRRVGGLLATIVARKTYAKMRRKYPTNSPIEDISQLREATDWLIDDRFSEPEAESSLREMVARIAAEMTPSERKALDMYVDQSNDYTVYEIAKRCRRSVTTVEDVIARFTARLRDELDSPPTDGPKSL